MMHAPLPLTRELVLIGGGHTHALVLRRWGMNPLPGARLTLINPGPTAPYTGMLPGFVAGHYDRDALSIDLVQLARFAGARLILGAVEGIDRVAQRIHVAGRVPVAYDLSSINIGITSEPPDLPGFAEHAIAAKPLGPYAQRWTSFRDAVARGEAVPKVAMIGGGVGGIELSLAMAHGLRETGARPEITVIEHAAALPGLHARSRAALLSEMGQLGVTLIEGIAPVAVTADGITLSDGRKIASAFMIGVAGARAQGWLGDTGLVLQDGFVAVDAELHTSDPLIYAAGDCAALPTARPKAGVYAVREAPVLAHNLRADLTGGPRKRYKPQADYLKLISLGGKSALADKYGGRLQGAWLWRWKDRIDRKFMDQFAHLPQMPAPALPREAALGLQAALGDKPLCGGCGAKVGGDTLGDTLQALPRNARTDVLSQPGDDAAVLRMGEVTQVLTTDHLRALTEDPWTMARIAAIHAMGDIWAMGATPQAATATVILPRLAEKMQAQWLHEIMSSAAEIFAAEGAEIVGGHTSLGSELTIGFSVTGLLDRPAITLAGARAGDALIVTKPIGSGTIMAAEMAMQARGDWVAGALLAMTRPQGKAARALGGAHAMTDVTGFGLAGHLLAICRASNLGAELNLRSIPTLPGAEQLAAQGVRSSLYLQNRALAADISVPANPRTELLFDPQTAGGLLAAVPAVQAGAMLSQLAQAGYSAALIGEMTDTPPIIQVFDR